MSLRDGTKKMSKSDPSDMSRINLTDDADTIAQKLRKARTDPEPLPSELDGLAERPEARNLVNIYAALADMTPEAVIAEYGGQGFGAFKPALADLAVDKLSPISAEMTRLMQDVTEIDRILDAGAARANAIAQPILEQCYDIVGLIRAARMIRARRLLSGAGARFGAVSGWQAVANCGGRRLVGRARWQGIDTGLQDAPWPVRRHASRGWQKRLVRGCPKPRATGM